MAATDMMSVAGGCGRNDFVYRPAADQVAIVATWSDQTDTMSVWSGQTDTMSVWHDQTETIAVWSDQQLIVRLWPRGPFETETISVSKDGGPKAVVTPGFDTSAPPLNDTMSFSGFWASMANEADIVSVSKGERSKPDTMSASASPRDGLLTDTMSVSQNETISFSKRPAHRPKKPLPAPLRPIGRVSALWQRAHRPLQHPFNVAVWRLTEAEA